MGTRRGHGRRDVAAMVVRELDIVALCVAAADDEVVNRACGGITAVWEAAVTAVDGIQNRRVLQLRDEVHVDDVLEADLEQTLVKCGLEDRVMTGETVVVVVEIRIVGEDDDADARILEAHDGIKPLHERRVRIGVHVDTRADAILAAVHGLADDLNVLDVALRMGEDLVHLHGGVRHHCVGVDIHAGNLLDCHACRVTHRCIAVNADTVDGDGLGKCGLNHCQSKAERDE